MDYQITLWEDGIKKEVHQFDMPYGMPRWYVSVTSIGAFSTREGTKLYQHNLKGKRDVVGKRCHVRFGDEITFEESMAARLEANYGIKPDVLPIFTHATVWDFYKAVGYDWKKQKYVS